MQVCKYLTRFRRVAYNSLEQGLSLSLQKAWERVGMAEVGNRIILLNKEQLKELRTRLKKKQSPDVIVIDSVHYLRRFNMDQYQTLRDEFPDKLFIFIGREKAGQPKGMMAQNIRYDSEIKITVWRLQGICYYPLRGCRPRRGRRGLRDMGGRRTGVLD